MIPRCGELYKRPAAGKIRPTQQIKHAVDVLERFCRQGLIVVYADHREVAGVWFQAGCPPTKVTVDVAQQLARQEGGPHFMLYTKGHGATPGHFEGLIPKQAHATHKATGSRMSGFAVHVPVFVGGMESETPNPRPRQRFKLADFQPVLMSNSRIRVHGLESDMLTQNWSCPAGFSEGTCGLAKKGLGQMWSSTVAGASIFSWILKGFRA